MSTNTLYINFGIEKIPFELRAKRKASRSITIKVKPDCQVIVLAPPLATHDEIILAVNKRARWVYNKLKAFEARQEELSPQQYISGESHYYLGKKYTLKVIDESGVTPQIKLTRGHLQIIASNTLKDRQKLLEDWYQQKAFDVFNQRFNLLLPRVSWVKERPLLCLKTMKSRWGSCSIKGKITLNTHLIKASLACIDSVILHELCHLKEHNHSDKFYRLLTQVHPEWKQVKQYLDQRAHLYLLT